MNVLDITHSLTVCDIQSDAPYPTEIWCI